MLNPIPEIPLPAPENFVLPAAAVQLPLARQPFDRNWPVYDMGKMDVPCPDCEALHWISEKLSHSSQMHPKFGMCCFKGKIRLPKIEVPPAKLLNYLWGQDIISKEFRDNIRQYNNVTMTANPNWPRIKDALLP